MLTNVQHVIPTVTIKDATNKVVANVTKAARAVTFCRESTSAWVPYVDVLCSVEFTLYSVENVIGAR